MMYVALMADSMTQGLQAGWGLITSAFPSLAEEPAVREEAFCQGRRHLPQAFWRSLWQRLRDRYVGVFPLALLFHGLYRVLAIDGTLVSLPSGGALRRFFGQPRNQNGKGSAPQARLVAWCSVFTGFCLEFLLLPLRWSEHTALRHLIRRLQPNDLALLDAGFFSYSALVAIPRRGAHFVMRISSQVRRYAHLVGRLGRGDWIVGFTPSAAVRRKDPALPREVFCRLLAYQVPGFRPGWILTSLTDPRPMPPQELIHLYHHRWRIETIYREWKHVLDIQNLRSHTPQGIYKEVYAQLMLYNLTRWVMTEAAQGTPHLPVDLSFTHCLTHVKTALLAMTRASSSQCQAIYARLLADIRAHPIRKRPGRQYPRRHDGVVKNKGHGKKKLPARLRRR
jgi:hypothetical protein